MKSHKIKWILALTGAIVIVLLLRGFAFTTCLIPSSGMENSLFPGDRILVNKWSYGLRTPFMSLFSYHRWLDKPVNKYDIVVFNNPAQVGEPIIDRRDIFIGRCIATPGDTLLVDSLFTASVPDARTSPDRKRLYSYPANKEPLMASLIQTLSIGDNGLMGSKDSTHVRSFSRYEYYLLNQALDGQNWIQLLADQDETDLNPLIIPGKGQILRVYPWNITLLMNTLVLHEGRDAKIKNDTLYADGKAVQHCYFTKDYYWMSSNNSTNLTDSRLFGFVPKDHIIGKAQWVWFSKERETGLFDGYRWDRFFHSVD